jgi:hypothetical protein
VPEPRGGVLVLDQGVDLGFEGGDEEGAEGVAGWECEELDKVWDRDGDPTVAACPAGVGKVVSAVKRPS